jgi:predicted amidohydrolase
MRIAAVQHDIVWGDRQANFEHVAPMIRAAAGAGARFVLLTETFSTGFVTDHAIGEVEGGPSSQFLVEQSRLHDVWVGGSCPEVPQGSDDERPFNSFVIAGPDGTIHRYRKIHPFTYGGEDKYFRAGDELITIDVDGLRVSPLVCYDLRFADEFWPMAPTTDLYVVPANWPEPRRDHWQTLLRARAIENQAYVIGCNRVGRVDRVNYVGDSAIIDPLGRVLSQASVAETVLFADVEAEQVQRVRARFPFLADRR